MADIAAQPLQNYGNLLTSYGQGVADQNLTRAQTGLVGQQTQAASIQNQIAQARLPVILQAYAAAQQQQAAANAPATGAASADQSGVNPFDMEAGGQFNPQAIDAKLRQQFTVNPAGRPQDQAALQQANLTGDPGLIAMAQGKLKMNLESDQYNAQKQASNFYDEMASVQGYNQTPGTSALKTLEAVAPNTAASIEKQYADNPQMAEKVAHDYATHMAMMSHMYTGREAVVGTDGLYHDKVSGQIVPGIQQVGLGPEQVAKIQSEADEMVTVTRHGAKTQIPRHDTVGMSHDAYVAARVNGWQPQQGAGQTAGQPTNLPPQARIAASRAPNPNSAMGALDKDHQNFVQNLPGEPDFMNTGNREPTPAETKQQTDYGAARGELMQSIRSDTAASQQSLTEASRIQNILNTNPHLGPGSHSWAQFLTWMSNSAQTVGIPASLIDQDAGMRQLLEKTLGQTGLTERLSEVRAEGGSVRLGAQESKLLLNNLSASPEMSRTAIQQMIDWQKSDAGYTGNRARTLQAALNYNNMHSDKKDLSQVEALYDQRYPRSSNVQTGLSQPTRPGQQSSGARVISTQAQYNALPPGTPFVFNGRAGTKGGQ